VTKVKICGITSVDDAKLAVDAGADAIGVIFWAGSRRVVEVATAQAIVRALPAFVWPVGVFVDATPDQVRDVADAVGLSAVQLHGDELVSDWRHFPRPVLKALPLARYAASSWKSARAAILIDAIDAGTRGGSGRTVDWTAARDIAVTRPLVLAGGLTPDNVAAAISCVRPWGVDVASGVEQSPGVKDAGKVRAFVQAVRRAALDTTEAQERGA